MSRVPISELNERDLVDGTYLVSLKQLALTKHGKPYLRLRLQDKTGEIEARVWEDAEARAEGFEQGDVAFVRGVVEAFNNALQMRLDHVRRVPPDEVDPSEFLPTSRYDVSEMWDRLLGIVADIRNPHVRDLLHGILTDPKVAPLFKRAPAAKGIHHPWIGGLLEHVLSLCHLAKRVCPHYPHIDEDQVLFGCIMHDLGKIWELSYESSFGYTDEGRLIGHLVTGVIVTDREVSKRPDFPPELAMRLKHILLAHHGTYEFGSPKLPQTLEAELVHRLDDLDSKITAITDALRAPSGEPTWSDYNRSLGRAFFRGSGEAPEWPERMVPLPQSDREGVPEEPRPAKSSGTSKSKPAEGKADASLDLFAKVRKLS